MFQVGTLASLPDFISFSAENGRWHNSDTVNGYRLEAFVIKSIDEATERLSWCDDITAASVPERAINCKAVATNFDQKEISNKRIKVANATDEAYDKTRAVKRNRTL